MVRQIPVFNLMLFDSAFPPMEESICVYCGKPGMCLHKVSWDDGVEGITKWEDHELCCVCGKPTIGKLSGIGYVCSECVDAFPKGE